MGLREEIIALAKKEASLREHLVPLLKESGESKVAIQQSTRDFIDYILTTRDSKPLAQNEVMQLLKRAKVPQKPPIVRAKPRFKQGDHLFLDFSFGASTSAFMGEDPVTGDPLDLSTWNCKRCVCIAADSSSVTLEMDDGTTVMCPWGQKPTKTPLFKFTPKIQITGTPPLEIIYLKEPGKSPIPKKQEMQAVNYLGRGGKGEQRALNYYTGCCFGWRLNKQGQPYFQVMAQQRYQIDGTGCGKKPWDAVRPTSFNPLKGQVLYIGLLGHRPKGWEQKFAQIKAQSLAP
jgi:hypothetical protein